MTQYVKFTGVGKWMHRLFELDTEFNQYNMVLYPDKASLKRFVEAGCQATVKEDEDGEFVKLKRENNRVTRNGKLIEFGPPKVVDEDGQDWDVNKIIGNGSKVEVTAAVYPTSRGNGTRIHQVRVLEHVNYVPEPEAA